MSNQKHRSWVVRLFAFPQPNRFETWFVVGQEFFTGRRLRRIGRAVQIVLSLYVPKTSEVCISDSTIIRTYYQYVVRIGTITDSLRVLRVLPVRGSLRNRIISTIFDWYVPSIVRTRFSGGQRHTTHAKTATNQKLSRGLHPNKHLSKQRW